MFGQNPNKRFMTKINLCMMRVREIKVEKENKDSSFQTKEE